jgi:hypothetical protein
MDAVKNLNRSRQEPSGVWGVERSDSDDGNWGGPPRPGDLRVCHRRSGSYNRFTPGRGRCAGWASEAAVVLLEPSGQHNRR